MKTSEKISSIKEEIAFTKKEMKTKNKSLFNEFIKLQNELNDLLVNELSIKEYNTYKEVAERHNKTVFVR